MTSPVQIGFDASGVKSRAFRRVVEKALEELSLDKAEGVWDSLRSPSQRLRTEPMLLVGDLGQLGRSSAFEDWIPAPAPFFVVLCARTARDEQRLASPDVALRMKDERVFLLDVKHSRHSQADESVFVRDYFRALVARLRPDRVFVARFSAVDGVLWVEFGDGLYRAVEWARLPFAGELAIAPVAAAVREQGQSVLVRDAAGREIDVDSGSLRAAVDADYRGRLASEDRSARQTNGARLRALRESLSLSQEELSRRSGIPQESLSRIERGHRDPRLETLTKLAGGCGLTLAGLLERLSDAGQTGGA
jgi:DNA-binding XRE family transcriptional regulator